MVSDGRDHQDIKGVVGVVVCLRCYMLESGADRMERAGCIASWWWW